MHSKVTGKDIMAETEAILTMKYESYYRLAYRMVRNQEDALDVVQESAYKAIRDCGKVENPGYLSTWIYRIVVNTALDLLRKQKREQSSENLPEGSCEERYGEMELQESLNCLDEKSRSVIILRYFEDMKLEEIAQITDENLNTVKARLYRALKKLRVDWEPGNQKVSRFSRKGVRL